MKNRESQPEETVKMKDVEGLVVFAVLMENGGGILDKSPSYIAEKYKLAMILPHPEKLLDRNNLGKFKEWIKTWAT